MQGKFIKQVSRLSMLALMVPTLSWGQAYSFKQCVEKTLNENPKVTASQYRLKQAELSLDESNAHRLPQITLSAKAVNSNDALNVFGMKLQQRQASFNDFGFAQYTGDPSIQPKDLNNPGAHSDFNTSLEIRVPVWNGGKVTSYQNQAKAMIEAAKHGNEAVRQYLVFNVYQAYEGVHTAKAFVQVANQSVKASKEYVRTTENLVRQGIVVKSELLSAKVHLSQAITTLQKAQTQVLIAKDSLRDLMNLDSGADFEVGDRQDVHLPVNNLAELTTLATTMNPSIEASREEARSSSAAVEVSNADNYPSFNMMARGDTHDPSLGIGSTSYTVAGMMSWKLTDFGATTSKVDKAQAFANEKKAMLRVKENKTRLAVLKAWRMLQVVKNQYHSNKLAVAQAEEAQRLVLIRYKGGVATITEILASQAQLDKTRADLVRTQYDINLQKARIRLTTGSMDYTLL